VEFTQVFERCLRLSRELQPFTDLSVDVTCNGFSRTRKGKIINLSQEEELVAKKVGRVNRAVMGCAPKPEFSGFEDPSDVLFPKFVRL